MVLRPSFHSTSFHSFLPPCCFRTCVAITGFRSQTSSPLGNLQLSYYQHLPSREGGLGTLNAFERLFRGGKFNMSKVQISRVLLGKGEMWKCLIGRRIYQMRRSRAWLCLKVISLGGGGGGGVQICYIMSKLLLFRCFLCDITQYQVYQGIIPNKQNGQMVQNINFIKQFIFILIYRKRKYKLS